MLTLILAVTLSQTTCPDCSVVGQKAALCQPHSKQERAAFARARGLRSEAEKLDSLKGLAQLTSDHVNAPSERVARRIADSLSDKSYPVREYAASLLGEPQHALIAMKALMKVLPDLEKELDKLDKAEAKLEKKMRSGTVREKQREDLERKLAENSEQTEAILGVRTAVIDQLGNFRDDRVVDTLCDITTWSLDPSMALARLGTRKAMESVSARLRQRQELLSKLEEQRLAIEERLDNSRVPKKQQYRLFDEMILAEIKSDISVLEQDGKRNQQLLIHVLEQQALGPPELGEWEPERFVQWLEAERDSFPDRLPGVTSPAWQAR